MSIRVFSNHEKSGRLSMTKRSSLRNLASGTALIAGIIGVGVGVTMLQHAATAQQDMVDVPMFEVDPLWPKPIPGEALLGMTIGASIDAQDNLWVVHRGASTLHNNEKGAELNPPTADCCKAAAPVLAFNPAGEQIKAWGGAGAGYEWPESMHGVFADHKGNIWLGGNGAKDAQILKFTPDGKFLAQSGHQGKNTGSNDPDNFGRVAQLYIDPKTNEGYVADGYRNRRLAVIDGDTGKIKRWWGAYGKKPDDGELAPYTAAAAPAQQYRNPVHCVAHAEDGLLYVCDRVNDRIQVFAKDGKFQKEVFVEKNTKGDGAVWDIAFSKDKEQKYFYMADGSNEKIHVFDRVSLTELTAFGDGGRQPGQFYAVHSIATDSKGNIYTTETYEGKRVQRFMYKGIGSVTKGEQGVVWPKK
jgi:sugar lactone lactonase YvrE